MLPLRRGIYFVELIRHSHKLNVAEDWLLWSAAAVYVLLH